MDYSKANSDVLVTFHADFAVKGLSLSKIEQSTVDIGLDIIIYGQLMPTEEEQDDLEIYCIFDPVEESDEFTVV